MERIKNLDRYQKSILMIMAVMLIAFTVIYAVTTSRIGFEYKDSILTPSEENGSVVYSGKVEGQPAAITVSSDKSVTFVIGEKRYGPYTASEDPSAIPENDSLSEHMTGVEIRSGEDIFFRGGVFRSGGDLMLFDEDGGLADFAITVRMSDGTVMDGEGNVVDQMAPSASTILRLLDGPELTKKGEWAFWFLGLFVCAVTAVSILFVDELFHWDLSFKIRNADRAEPSDWELTCRYIGWTVLPIMALVVFIMGLQ